MQYILTDLTLGSYNQPPSAGVYIFDIYTGKPIIIELLQVTFYIQALLEI